MKTLNKSIHDESHNVTKIDVLQITTLVNMAKLFTEERFTGLEHFARKGSTAEEASLKQSSGIQERIVSALDELEIEYETDYSIGYNALNTDFYLPN